MSAAGRAKVRQAQEASLVPPASETTSRPGKRAAQGSANIPPPTDPLGTGAYGKPTRPAPPAPGPWSENIPPVSSAPLVNPGSIPSDPSNPGDWTAPLNPRSRYGGAGRYKFNF